MRKTTPLSVAFLSSRVIPLVPSQVSKCPKTPSAHVVFIFFLLKQGFITKRTSIHATDGGVSTGSARLHNFLWCEEQNVMMLFKT